MNDYAQHNAEQAAVWAAFRRGTPTRVPMAIGCNPRMILLDPELNPKGYSFRDCFENPAIMFDVDLQFAHWQRHAIPHDMERGLPEKWVITPNFQNCYDAAWLGAPIYYIDGDVPDTRPFLHDDNKRLLFDRGIPDPFSGLMGTLRETLDYYQQRAARESYCERPIEIGTHVCALGFDGLFTIACCLRGATELCLDLYEDPEYVRELLAFIQEAVLTRQAAWAKYLDVPLLSDSVGMADDSIALLSCEAYREWVLPLHQQYVTRKGSPGAAVSMHLCGDATRHFVTIRDALGVRTFDTGFPVDHGRLRSELGADVIVQGGPNVNLLLHGTPEEVAAETTRILRSGAMEGGKFILREANNLAPRTPMANIQAMYDACKRDGNYMKEAV